MAGVARCFAARSSGSAFGWPCAGTPQCAYFSGGAEGGGHARSCGVDAAAAWACRKVCAAVYCRVCVVFALAGHSVLAPVGQS